MTHPPCTSNPARFTTKATTPEEQQIVAETCASCPLRRECAELAVRYIDDASRWAMSYGDVYAAGVWLTLDTKKTSRYTAAARLRRIATGMDVAAA